MQNFFGCWLQRRAKATSALAGLGRDPGLRDTLGDCLFRCPRRISRAHGEKEAEGSLPFSASVPGFRPPSKQGEVFKWLLLAAWELVRLCSGR